MREVIVTVRDNGPNRIQGPVTVVDVEGNVIREVPEGERLALCRCGQALTKPFCDGTHREIGFMSVIRAGDVGPETPEQHAEEL